MCGWWPIYKRELKTYFQTPSTYVVLALFFLFIGMVFNYLFLIYGQRSLQAMQGGMFGSQAPNPTEDIIRQVFQLLTSLVMFIVPMLSMRLVAEEKSSGTFELIVTCPVSDWSILLGKYFALLTVGLSVLMLSAIYPILVWWVGRPHMASPEWPIVISCWIGLVLIFAAYAAFGVMASSFTDNQITAAVVTLIGLIFWNVMGAFQVESYPAIRAGLEEAAVFGHMENFINGTLMLKDFVFYVLATFLFLFIASKTLEARRWRV